MAVLMHLDQGEYTTVLLGGVIYTVSIPPMAVNC